MDYSGSNIESYIFNWFSSCGSPDLFNEGFNVSGFTPPNNTFGFQYPNHGNGFIGIQFYYTLNNNQNIREYAGVKLLDTLHKRKYYYEYYINYSSYPQDNTYKSIIKNTGLYFSTDSIKYLATPDLYTYTPDSFPTTGVYESNMLISDTINWVKIYGTFIANGDERYLYIGNFKPDSLTEFEDGFSQPVGYSYYYIDDVLVAESDTVLDIEENSIKNQINVYPNPTTGIFTVQLPNIPLQNARIEVFTITGGKVYSTNVANSPKQIALQPVADGVYYLRVWNNNQVIDTRKLVVVGRD